MDKAEPENTQAEETKNTTVEANTIEEPSTELTEAEKKDLKAFEDFLFKLSPENMPSKKEIERKFDTLNKERIFWDTQPVPKYSDYQDPEVKEGAIESDNKVEEVPKDPQPLLDQFEWCVVDVKNEKELDDVYNFLYENYVEDDDNMFRFDYSKTFLLWALTPPGYYIDWHVGVRVKKSKKLVGFITGIPVEVHANEKKFKAAEINFLCVHKKLRSNRLAPVLIKEVTRKVHLKDIWQAVYTAGTLIPTPITQARYYHRSLNPKKLIDIKFSSLPQNQTIGRMVKLYKVSDEVKLTQLRPMKPKDISSITKLLREYLAKTKVALTFSEADVKHWFTPIDGVVYTYVIEKNGNVSDLISFYCLPSSILKHEKYKVLKAAYAFYNVATTVSLTELMENALILANKEEFDVFNALNIMDNAEFFQELKFSQGDGNLHYYFYNWRMSTPLAPKDLGITLL